MFAPSWRKRLGAMVGERGAKGVVFRRGRI